MVGSKHLKLVAGTGDGSFQIDSLEQIGAAERDKIKQAVHEISPGAGVVGVMRGARSWDLRPVLMLFGESSPTILRFLGPELALSPELTKETFELFSGLIGKDSVLTLSGEHQGQLWYRRPLFERSLDQVLGSGTPIKPGRAFSIARALVGRIVDLHKAGVVHGHITTANVGLSRDDRVSLMDVGAAVALIRATRELALEKFPQGYDENTFAPELLNRNATASYSCDVFGLGLVLRALFVSALRNFSSSEESIVSGTKIVAADLQQLIDFADRLSSQNVIQRPSINEAKELIDNFGRPKSEQSQARQVEKPKPILQPTEPTVRPFPQDDFIVEKAEAPQAAAKPERPVVEPVFAPASKYDQLQFGESSLKPTDFSSRDRRSFLPYLLAVLIFLLGYYWYQQREDSTPDQVPVMTRQELTAAWESGLPSRMALVALTAVQNNEASVGAADLIVRSALTSGSLTGVDAGLIRTAFDKRWERSLTEEDRRTALALALSGLLRDQMPTDLPDLRSLHPGVLLAITASAGENVRRLLQTVPAATLRNLPIPYGIAFNELVSADPSLSCGDGSVIQLSRLATYGYDNVEAIAAFLADAPKIPVHLRALAQLSSHDNSAARALLATLLAHPNLKIDNANIIWGKRYHLLDWKELESTDQLFLLAGMPPAGEVSGENLAKLFSHPDPEIRKDAIREGIDKIKFSHPAAFSILSDLRKNPAVLTAGQTVRLMQILLSYKGVSAESAKKFVETKPPVDLCAALLLGTFHEKVAAPIDFELMRYLKEQNWTPEAAQLPMLAQHPDDFTRFFAYRAIFALADHDQAATMLIDARKHEKNPQFLEQLQSMIEFLASEQ